MTNALCTTTTPTNEECDELLIQGVCSIRDAILGYTRNGLVQKDISERIQFLGLKGSVATIQRHVKDLRDEGLLPAVGSSTSTEAVKKRKQRSKGTKPQNEGMSPTDDSSSKPITPEIVSNEPDVQSSNTPPGFRGGVRSFQSQMDSDDARYDKVFVPVGSTNDGRAAEDHAEVNRLIGEINTIFKRHYAPLEPGTFDGAHWTNFYHHFHSLCGTCEQYSREYRSQEKEYYDECLDNAKEWCDSISGGSGEDSDGQILRLVR